MREAHGESSQLFFRITIVNAEKRFNVELHPVVTGHVLRQSAGNPFC
jgi:hypothetical protein